MLLLNWNLAFDVLRKLKTYVTIQPIIDKDLDLYDS
jgi:hypothetical protein